MINFNSLSYGWVGGMNVLMRDVNLYEIKFNSGNSIAVSFLNSYGDNADHYKTLTCNNVWKFSIASNFDEGEGFAHFICDVRGAKLTAEFEIKSAFEYLKYGFGIPNSNEYHFVRMDSGEMYIDLICENFTIV